MYKTKRRKQGDKKNDKKGTGQKGRRKCDKNEGEGQKSEKNWSTIYVYDKKRKQSDKRGQKFEKKRTKMGNKKY